MNNILDEFLEWHRKEYFFDPSPSAKKAVKDFIEWQDTASNRTPHEAERQICPSCKGSGVGHYPAQTCCGTCDGTGQI